MTAADCIYKMLLTYLLLCKKVQFLSEIQKPNILETAVRSASMLVSDAENI